MHLLGLGIVFAAGHDGIQPIDGRNDHRGFDGRFHWTFVFLSFRVPRLFLLGPAGLVIQLSYLI